MKKIILTGGGTSGHVTPNLALIPKLKKENYSIHYIGTKNGIEHKLITDDRDITYHIIKAGKLRRYLSYKNVIDACKVMKGFLQACNIIRKVKPSVIFSKGGYVSTPVVWAAKVMRIPVVIHESDYTVGLANKLSIPFSTKVCFSFPETFDLLPRDKAVYTGIPIREELLNGIKEEGYKLTGFNNDKPVLLIMGGSQGSKIINSIIRDNLSDLTKDFQICHLCGEGNIDTKDTKRSGYKQFEYVGKELKDIYAITDVVVTRGGATTLFELLALKKRMLIIPLSKSVSRGDQILNAKSFSKQGVANYIEEEQLTYNLLKKDIKNLLSSKKRVLNINDYNGTNKVINTIKLHTNKRNEKSKS